MITIRRETNNYEQLQSIAAAFRREVGFIYREKFERGTTLVAFVGGVLAGFALYHSPKQGVNKGWNVLVALAVLPEFQHLGAGRRLLWSVPCPMRVTTIDPSFYLKTGMRMYEKSVSSIGTVLYRLERKRLFIFCAGGSRTMNSAAHRAGVPYGTQHKYMPYSQPFMVDIDWRDYDWQDYLHLVSKYQPVMAMMPDFEHPEQYVKLPVWAADLRNVGVLYPMVALKQEKEPHKGILVAISAPAKSVKYGGYLPEISLGNRPVHILGGTPQTQIKLFDRFNVISADGNSHQTAATRGAFWLNGRWYRPYPDFGGKHADWDGWKYEDRLAVSTKLISRRFAR